MRHADGGELTAEGRTRREAARPEAAAMLGAGATAARVAIPIKELSGMGHGLIGVCLLPRMGWSPQVPTPTPATINN